MRKAWNIKKKKGGGGAGGLKNFRKRELIINIHDTGDTSFLLSFANSGFLLFSFSFFYKLKFCGNFMSIKSTGSIFLRASAHLSLSHFDNSYTTNIFIIILFIVVICDK